MKKVRIGVIGVGYLGSIHARLLKEIPSAELVGVYDIDEDKKNKVAEELSVYSAKNAEELISMVDAVTCAVSTSSHFEVGYEVLKKGRHLFMEKPLTTNLSKAKILVDEAKRKKLILQVGYIERFNPAIVAIRNIIKDPKFIEAERLSPFVERGTDVDVILDLMIHDIDILLSFKKERIKKIDAVGVPVITNKIDIANVRIEFEDGGVANLTASRISREPFRKIRFFQKDTYVSVNYREKNAQVYIKRDSKILPQKIEIEDKNPLMEELKNFINSVLGIEKPRVTGNDSLVSLEIALKIKRKIENNLKRVKV